MVLRDYVACAPFLYRGKYGQASPLGTNAGVILPWTFMQFICLPLGYWKTLLLDEDGRVGAIGVFVRGGRKRTRAVYNLDSRLLGVEYGAGQCPHFFIVGVFFCCFHSFFFMLGFPSAFFCFVPESVEWVGFIAYYGREVSEERVE